MTISESSFGPAVCRVCLCGESSIPYMGKAGGEPLISACHCKGTMGLYHKSCLEHWLYISKTTHCELCKFRFQYGTKNQNLCAYLRLRGWNYRNFRSLPADFSTVLFFTPLAILLIYYCIKGAMEDAATVEPGDLPPGESFAMLGLAFIITVTIFFWYASTALFHIQQFREWQKHHKLVFIVDQMEQTRIEHVRSLRDDIMQALTMPFCCWSRTRAQRLVVTMRDVDLQPQMLSPGTFTGSSANSPPSYSESSNSPESSSTPNSASSPAENFESARSDFPLTTFRPLTVIHPPLLTSSPHFGNENCALMAYRDDIITYDIPPNESSRFSDVDLGTPLSPILRETSSPPFACLMSLPETNL